VYMIRNNIVSHIYHLSVFYWYRMDLVGKRFMTDEDIHPIHLVHSNRYDVAEGGRILAYV
jgi:hypothetical protein